MSCRHGFALRRHGYRGCGGRDAGKDFTVRLDGGHHIWPFQARSLFFGCGLTPQQVGEGVRIVEGLVSLAVAKDATLVEVNPLAVTKDGHLVALDAKVNFDDSGLKRHPDIARLDDPEESDPLELRAREAGINYVHLDGYIGTMVNGAGLAMATMDAVRQAGGAAANFLDAGGSASGDMVAAGFRIMLSDPQVRGILVNIFGGILRCDIVAEGIVSAVKKVGMNIPLSSAWKAQTWKKAGAFWLKAALPSNRPQRLLKPRIKSSS